MAKQRTVSAPQRASKGVKKSSSSSSSSASSSAAEVELRLMLAAARNELEESRATLAALAEQAARREERAAALVWFSRNAGASAPDARTKAALAAVRKQYAREAAELAPGPSSSSSSSSSSTPSDRDVARFQAGFHSGVLAAFRLVNGVLHAEAEAEHVEGGAATAVAMRECAIEAFPDLHV